MNIITVQTPNFIHLYLNIPVFCIFGPCIFAYFKTGYYSLEKGLFCVCVCVCVCVCDFIIYIYININTHIFIIINMYI